MRRVLSLAGIVAVSLMAVWFLLATPLSRTRSGLFAEAVVGERIQELRPPIERALGRPFRRPIEFRVASAAQISAVLVRETPLFLADSRTQPAPVLKALSRMVMAKVELADGRLNLMPASFRFLDELTGGRFDLRTAPFRDVVLAHELVHVFQFQKIDAPRYYGRNAGIDELNGPASVIEGHAQFIAARVARHLGLEEQFDILTGLTTGDFPGLSESTRASIRAMSGWQAFPYYRGRQLVARVVRERGYEAAVEALLAQAPGNQLDVTIPRRYLPPPAGAASYEQAARRVGRYLAQFHGVGAKLRDPGFRRRRRAKGDSARELRAFAERICGEERLEHRLVCSVDLRLDWADRSVEELKELLAGFIAGDRYTPTYRTGVVALYHCRSDADAERLMPELERRALTAEGTWRRGQIEGRAWERINPRNEVVLDAYDLRRLGPVLIETRIDVTGRHSADTDVRRARCVFELVRSAYEPSPWAGAEATELPGRFIEAARSPEWGVRWRAVRNLGRLSPLTPGVAAAVHAALGDPGPDVRLAALNAVILWDRTEEVPASIREPLCEDADLSVRGRARRAWR